MRTIHCSRAEQRAAREGEGERRRRGEERGRQNRHLLLLLVPTARREQRPGTGVWILDFFTQRFPEQMESCGKTKSTERLMFFFCFVLNGRLFSSHHHFSLALYPHLIFSAFLPLLLYVHHHLPFPYLYRRRG